jgi:hypothetical protein
MTPGNSHQREAPNFRDRRPYWDDERAIVG